MRSPLTPLIIRVYPLFLGAKVLFLNSVKPFAAKAHQDSKTNHSAAVTRREGKIENRGFSSVYAKNVQVSKSLKFEMKLFEFEVSRGYSQT